ncbi:glycosyl hydrolase family 28-related protein [Mycobacterium sp. URHD0025]|uniref:glycosyl hydrolase family 28-related protein n=1 Tax=Mycobacterium sp. URHD0025 TaxID=1298864 RepID=UPI0018CBBC9B|nr:glycosyl hydrolase family 28-related protein [Mycobacterium sp. URHD0025]
MSIPRRSVLSAAALAVLAGCAPHARLRSVNVRDYGATGNGETDDSAGIQAAVRALRSGDTLYFPNGKYRFAEQNPPGMAAISITGISDVAIEFDSGAELVMDNLDEVDGTGTSHGILITGPASRIALRNVKIRWPSRPPRSLGDGIRIIGYPTVLDNPPRGWSGEPAPVSDVVVSGCEIRSSPQAGVILIGVFGIDMTDVQVHDTAADGLHVNACRRARIQRLTVTDNGDDGLALVTEYSDLPLFKRDEQTFAFPELTDWSNADFEITDVKISGGRANGVRLSGANRVQLRKLNVTEKRSGAGVMIDSTAEITAESEWQHVASRRVRLEDISVSGCEMGIQLLARPGPGADGRFTDFDVTAGNVDIRNCTNWAVRVESLTAQPVTGFGLSACTVGAISVSEGNGGVGLGNTRGLTLDGVSVTHSRLAVVFLAENTHGLAVDSLKLSVTQPTQPEDLSIPCAYFDDCEGRITSMDVSWPQAPASWIPVQLTMETFEAHSLAVEALTVTPASVTNHLGVG